MPLLIFKWISDHNMTGWWEINKETSKWREKCFENRSAQITLLKLREFLFKGVLFFLRQGLLNQGMLVVSRWRQKIHQQKLIQLFIPLWWFSTWLFRRCAIRWSNSRRQSYLWGSRAKNSTLEGSILKLSARQWWKCHRRRFFQRHTF